MFENIKLKLFRNKINSAAEQNSMPRIINNLRDVNHIGIVFDASSFSVINEIHDFRRELEAKGKKVEIFGYINSNEKKTENFLISNKDLNWYGYPQKKELFDFSNIQFDVLFGIFKGNNSPLNVILANSKSKLRLGVHDAENQNCFDVMLGVKQNATIKDIINSISKFLNEVKTK